MTTASPSTRQYARDKGVDLDALAARLGRERIEKADIDAGAGGKASAAAAPDHARYWAVDHAAYGPVREEPLSRVGRLAAANLTAAQQAIPAVTHHDEADVTAMERLRAEMKPEAAQRGVRITALAFHVKALARCLTAFPKFNASLSPDGETLILKDYVDVGIAVDTPHGLMVPVIRGVPAKGLLAIAGEIADLAARAQERKVRPEEMGGAGMTISNLGGIGGSAFSPIVNPPEVAILGLTRTATRPVWTGEAFEPRPMVPLDLSYDHRVINGADAARFLAHYAQLIGDPRRLLI